MCKEIVTSDELKLGPYSARVRTLKRRKWNYFGYFHEYTIWFIPINIMADKLRLQSRVPTCQFHRELHAMNFSTKIVRTLFSIRSGALLCLQVFYNFFFESALPSSQVTFTNLDVILAACLQRPGQTFERTKTYVSGFNTTCVEVAILNTVFTVKNWALSCSVTR